MITGVDVGLHRAAIWYCSNLSNFINALALAVKKMILDSNLEECTFLHHATIDVCDMCQVRKTRGSTAYSRFPDPVDRRFIHRTTASVQRRNRARYALLRLGKRGLGLSLGGYFAS
jgi:hypothetical protein